MAGESLGVVVLAYGGGREFAPLLDSLLEQGVEPTSILIVHNPAEPGEPAPVVPPGCEVRQTDRNLGYAGGMNYGIACLLERDVDLLLLLTHDARLREGALAALLSAARRGSRYGVLGPALVLAGTDTAFSFGGFTRSTGTNGHILKLPPNVADGLLTCDWIDGGTMLIRREVLERVGAFEERFWGYCEEAELCLRVRRSGSLVGVVVDALADQAPGGPKRPGAWIYLLTRNGTEYARRVAGARGVFTVTARTLCFIPYELLRALLRGAGLRPGGAREPWAYAIGAAWGSLDYFRGRWGPPPRGLPGMGDLHNA